MIQLLILLQVKHFVCDFLLQYPYHYLNKGKYGHLGGIFHALIHGAGTFLVFIYTPILGLLIALVEAVIHYHIDWAKMNLNKRFKLKPDNSEYFWHLLGFDQLLHQLTYVGIIAYAAARGII